MTTEDSQLLHDYLQNRSQEAFGRLMAKYVGFVFSVARKRAANHAMAEDITQAVFIVLARRAAHVQERSLAGWLHRTTVLTASNALRGEARQRQREHRIAGHRSSSFAIPPREPEMAATLDDALLRLRPRERDVIALHYFEGHELAAIATKLDLSAEAVRKRLARAVEHLREILRRGGVEVPQATVPAALTAIRAEWPVTHVADTEPAGHALQYAREMLHMIRMRLFKTAATVALTIVTLTGVAVAVAKPPVHAQLARTAPPTVLATTAPGTAPSTRPVLKFGEIIEQTIQGQVSGDSAVDFDTGTLHHGADVPSLAAMTRWLRETGVDSLALVTPPRGLFAWDMAAIPVQADAWDIAPEELRTRLAKVKSKVRNTLGGDGALPKTFLIRTREGGMGVVQILEFVQEPQGFRIRYHMLQPAAATTRPHG